MKIKGSNLGAMPKNDKQKEGFESKRDVGEHEIKKGRDRIWERSQKTRIKTKGLNLGAMPKIPK